jgi:hypothetical protein
MITMVCLLPLAKRDSGKSVLVNNEQPQSDGERKK